MTHIPSLVLCLLAAVSWTRAVAGTPDAVVAADGSGDFRTVQEAIDAAPQLPAPPRWVIFIKAGYYHAPVYVMREKRYVSLVGEDPLRTVLAFDLTAGTLGPGDRPIGTFRTPSTWIDADDFSAENLTFENSAGPNGQALALRVDGDRVVFRNCRLLGWQDTLLVNRGRHYFEDCYIAGHVDFIFGGATAFFERCQIHCWRDGYVTAASTPSDAAFGFVFSRCRISGEAPEVRTYLGRPRRDFANVLFVDTWMDAVVQPEGWHDWDRLKRRETARFAEVGSRGPGGDSIGRVAWAHHPGPEETASITVQAVLGGADGWNPGPRAEQPSCDVAAIGRNDAFAVPGFTVEGVLRYAAQAFPEAGVARVEDRLLPDVTAFENVVYARPDGQELCLDIFRPEGAVLRPAVLVIHGGGWIGGDRFMERPFAKHLAARGFVAVSVSYRLGPNGRFPNAVHDLKAAIRWLRAHAGDYGIDVAHIGAVGGSAGGTLAAMLGASNGVAALEGDGGEPDHSSTVQAVVCLDGAVDFVDPRLIAAAEADSKRFWVFFRGAYRTSRETWLAASPITHVGRRSAPTLFVNSTATQPILPGREEMCARLQALGIDARVVTLHDTPHPFWLVHPWFERAVDETTQFLACHLEVP